MFFIQQHLRTPLFISLLFLSPLTQANPVACFNSNMGNFCIELFETQVPNTTANFLAYINNEAYTNGIFHRSVPGFVVQGGGFKIVDNALTDVETFAPVENEFKISNTRGTVAMAKVGGNPDSATSQWFVNLADNATILNGQNGGFTVFGRVIFEGMNVIDKIENLPVANLGGSFGETPTINFDGVQLLVSNLVQTNSVEVTEVSGIFSDGTLSFAVDVGAGKLLDVRLLLIEDSPNIVFELDPTSITPIQTIPENSATFSSQESTLFIPSVMINASTVVSNVFMTLTDPNNFQFTVQSFETAN